MIGPDKERVVIQMRLDGHGLSSISRATGLTPDLVRQVIRDWMRKKYDLGP